MFPWGFYGKWFVSKNSVWYLITKFLFNKYLILMFDVKHLLLGFYICYLIFIFVIWLLYLLFDYCICYLIIIFVIWFLYLLFDFYICYLIFIFNIWYLIFGVWFFINIQYLLFDFCIWFTSVHTSRYEKDTNIDNLYKNIEYKAHKISNGATGSQSETQSGEVSSLSHWLVWFPACMVGWAAGMTLKCVRKAKEWNRSS